ncbi:MAG: ATP synthase subunit I [Thermodesulfovibrionales bacterium]|nr:ATP synthase subunit I [Thermodesulfovibrionales bacterium]
MNNQRLIRRFSKTALVVWGIAIVLAALLFSKQVAFGVIVGGAMGLLNMRGMARGVTGLDINNPRPARMFFGGAVRLVVICAAIVLIAMTRSVNLLGLLAGFILVVFVVVAEGVREMRLISREDQGELSVNKGHEGENEGQGDGR